MTSQIARQTKPQRHLILAPLISTRTDVESAECRIRYTPARYSPSQQICKKRMSQVLSLVPETSSAQVAPPVPPGLLTTSALLFTGNTIRAQTHTASAAHSACGNVASSPRQETETPTAKRICASTSAGRLASGRKLIITVLVAVTLFTMKLIIPPANVACISSVSSVHMCVYMSVWLWCSCCTYWKPWCRNLIFVVHVYLHNTYVILDRLFRVDQIQWVSNVRLPVRTSVSPSVCLEKVFLISMKFGM